MSYDLIETTHKELRANKPEVAVLPWGATEAHNNHLPYGSDVTEAREVSLEAARLAEKEGARVIVLPSIPFGNNAQHLDHVATIHLKTRTAYYILSDVIHSLKKQGIEKLLIVNSHGGNNFKPLIRDLIEEYGVLVVLADIPAMVPDKVKELFDNPGDHAGQLETSFMMYLAKREIDLSEAGKGSRKPFEINGLDEKGVWTPRPWSRTHSDLGSGNPEGASAEKGELYFKAVCNSLKNVITGLSNAKKGDLPF